MQGNALGVQCAEFSLQHEIYTCKLVPKGTIKGAGRIFNTGIFMLQSQKPQSAMV